MPTAVPTPPTGIKHSESTVAGELLGGELLVGIRPTALDASKYENINLPTTLLASPQQIRLTVDELIAQQGTYTPGQQYLITNAPAGEGASLAFNLGGDEGPTTVWAQDADTLVPIGVSGGAGSGNSDAFVQVYAQGTRDLLLLVLEALGKESFDPYEVSLDIRQAVADGFAAQDAANNDSPFLEEPQPDGSLVGMEFVDPQLQYIYTYCPVGFANGTFNVWRSTILSR